MAELFENGDYRHLQVYAAGRLRQLGLNAQEGIDLVHEAIQAVLLGLNGERQGRHPRWQDLRDRASFQLYMKQVIKSVATSVGRHHRCLDIVSLEQPQVAGETFTPGRWAGPEASMAPDQNIGIRDLRHELFLRLGKRAPTRLRRILKSWKRDFCWADTIQLRGSHRQYRAQLRALAQQILLEIEPALWPTQSYAPVDDAEPNI